MNRVVKYKSLHELIYLVCYAIYVFFSTLKYSMLGQTDTASQLISAFRLISILGIIVSILLLKYVNKKYLLISTALIIVFIASSIKTSDHGGLLMMIVILGAWGINEKKMARIFILENAIILILSYVLSIAGVIEDRTLSFYRVRGDVFQRHAYGMTYATIFTAMVFFITATIVYYSKLHEKKTSVKIIATLILFGIYYYVYRGTRGRLEFLMEIVMIIYILFPNIWNSFSKSKFGGFFNRNCFSICFIISILLVLTKEISDNLFSALDWFMTGRLSLAVQAIEQYGINLLGNKIQMYGNGSLDIESQDYFFIDSYYLNWLLVYGIIIMPLMCVLCRFLNKRICVLQNYNTMFYIMIACVHGIIISSIMTPNINPFFCIGIAEISNNVITQNNS